MGLAANAQHHYRIQVWNTGFGIVERRQPCLVFRIEALSPVGPDCRQSNSAYGLVPSVIGVLGTFALLFQPRPMFLQQIEKQTLPLIDGGSAGRLKPLGVDPTLVSPAAISIFQAPAADPEETVANGRLCEVQLIRGAVELFQNKNGIVRHSFPVTFD